MYLSLFLVRAVAGQLNSVQSLIIHINSYTLHQSKIRVVSWSIWTFDLVRVKGSWFQQKCRIVHLLSLSRPERTADLLSSAILFMTNISSKVFVRPECPEEYLRLIISDVHTLNDGWCFKWMFCHLYRLWNAIKI